MKTSVPVANQLQANKTHQGQVLLLTCRHQLEDTCPHPVPMHPTIKPVIDSGELLHAKFVQRRIVFISHTRFVEVSHRTMFEKCIGTVVN